MCADEDRLTDQRADNLAGNKENRAKKNDGLGGGGNPDEEIRYLARSCSRDPKIDTRDQNLYDELKQ
jgi:hypothetical protein